MDDQAVTGTDDTVMEIGIRIRELRKQRGMTLVGVAERTGLSASLLSMVERGRTSPSIGTLVAVARALGVHMSELFNPAVAPAEPDPVRRADSQQAYETAEGVLRRIVQADTDRGFEFAINEYGPGTRSAPTPTHHDGYEYGVVLEGSLRVELDGRTFELSPGDAISYDSGVPHLLANDGSERCRAVWVNFDR